MRLVARGGRPFSVTAAFGWAVSWGLGAGLGIAAGAWLTVVGEAGAPGIESIDPGSEFITLPLAALAVVTVVHLAGQLVAAVWRGSRGHEDAAETANGGGHTG